MTRWGQKTLHVFRPILDAECVVLYVERLMAREVRCRVTD